MEKDKSIPFSESNMTENIIDFFSDTIVDADNADYLLSEEATKEAMKIEGEIAELFITHNTNVGLSYQILCSMADAVYAYMLLDFKTK